MLGSEDYGRVRLGIGPKTPAQIDSADFVLQKFNTSEQTNLPKLTREVNALLSEYAYGAPVAAETRSFL
jgi:peptidyl-tRNA hydrolase